MWDVIAVTAETTEAAILYTANLKSRRTLYGVPESDDGKGPIIMAVSDPCTTSASGKYRGVGSGGATMNAALYVAEQLSAKRGRSSADLSIFHTLKALVLHCSSIHHTPVSNLLGKGFTDLPGVRGNEDGHIRVNNVDILLQHLHRMGASSQKGLWVSSTECFLSIPSTIEPIKVSEGITAFGLPTDPALAVSHGVYQIEKDTNRLVNVHYQFTNSAEQQDALQPDGTVLFVSPLVYFCPKTIATLLSLHANPVLSCTYYGYDSGFPPQPINLFLDIVAPHNPVFAEESLYCRPKCNAAKMAKNLLQKTLESSPRQVVVLPKESQFAYIRTPAQYMSFVQGPLRSPGLFPVKPSSFCMSSSEVPSSCILDNTIVHNGVQIGEGCLFQNSELHTGSKVGKASYGHGVILSDCDVVEPDTVIQSVSWEVNRTPYYCTFIHGTGDNIHGPFQTSTFCGEPWAAFIERMGIRVEDLWDIKEEDALPTPPSWGPTRPEASHQTQTLFTARLFTFDQSRERSKSESLKLQFPPEQGWVDKWKGQQRVSMQEILKRCTVTTQAKQMRGLSREIVYHGLEQALRGTEDLWVIPALNHQVLLDDPHHLLHWFDDILPTLPQNLMSRGFEVMADLLAIMAGSEGGLRSGPARNQEWKPAFDKIAEGDVASAVPMLASVRESWMDSPERIMRASRHYEGAAGLLIALNVSTASKFADYTQMGEDDPRRPGPGCWVTVSSPARLDMAGGWTDMAPIAYAYGGRVINVAVTVDGMRPIEGIARRLTEPILVLWTEQGERLECKDVADLADYSHPFSPCALVKAAIIAVEIVDMKSGVPLQQQLEALGGGIEIKINSYLPNGSGMGGSSILAAAVLRAIGLAVGRFWGDSALVHAVLVVEQLLSSGGGWQDQVGALYPRVKVCQSKAVLPLQVETDICDLPEDTLSLLDSHMVLIYTGTARLARNLLQNVRRRWASRNPSILKNVEALVANTHDLESAFYAGDISKIGQCVDKYSAQKKTMAGSGVEPPVVTEVLNMFRSLIHGASLAGAGGGGFLFLITKKPNMASALEDMVAKSGIEGSDLLKFHQVSVAREGFITSYSQNEE